MSPELISVLILGSEILGVAIGVVGIIAFGIIGVCVLKDFLYGTDDGSYSKPL